MCVSSCVVYFLYFMTRCVGMHNQRISYFLHFLLLFVKFIDRSLGSSLLSHIAHTRIHSFNKFVGGLHVRTLYNKTFFLLFLGYYFLMDMWKRVKNRLGLKHLFLYLWDLRKKRMLVDLHFLASWEGLKKSNYRSYRPTLMFLKFHHRQHQ